MSNGNASPLLVRRLIVVAALVGVMGLVLFFAPRRATSIAEAPREGDIALFQAVVGNMHAGQDYYDASGHQLRERGYPTRSPFNWRQPALYQLLGNVPFAVAYILIAIIGVIILIESNRLLAREPLGLVMVVNAVIGMAIPPAVYLTEAWAGGCLALSALAYARNQHRRGAAWGLGALFIRELAGPYCVLAACTAIRRRRWQELAVWGGGIALYAVYYGLHVWNVLQHARPGDRTHVESWLYFGGLPFVLQIWQVNGLLMLAPSIVLAIAVAAGVAAWWSPQMPVHIRGCVLVYSVLFLVVGQPFNQYWGLLIAPITAMWLTYAPSGFGILWGLPVAHERTRARPAIV
jgi:hypothetical protein